MRSCGKGVAMRHLLQSQVDSTLILWTDRTTKIVGVASCNHSKLSALDARYRMARSAMDEYTISVPVFFGPDLSVSGNEQLFEVVQIDFPFE